MNLIALPAFTDNSIWMLHDCRQAIVVDPGESAPVIKALDAQQLVLAAILVTHHHADHVGGVDALRARLHGPVHGPKHGRIPEPYERWVNPFLRCGEPEVAHSARTHGADADTPVAVLAAPRPWKNDFR